jgi:hypothetical protein
MSTIMTPETRVLYWAAQELFEMPFCYFLYSAGVQAPLLHTKPLALHITEQKTFLLPETFVPFMRVWNEICRS